MRRIVRKLGNNSGESIAELLISILISVLGITLLAIMIQTSSKLILSSTKKIMKYAESENKLINKSDSPAGDSVVEIMDTAGRLYKLYKNCGNLEVNLYEMAFGEKKIIAFEKK